MIGKEQNRKRIIIQIVVTIALSIVAILFFLFSIKGVLLSESKQRLLEINHENFNSIQSIESLETKQSSGKNEDIVLLERNSSDYYLDQRTYSFILDETGRIVGAFGEMAAQEAYEFGYELGQFIELSDTYRLQLEQEECIEHIKLTSGEEVYLAIQVVDVVTGGYLVTMVEKSVVDQEINSIYRIAIVIVVLALTALMLAVVYNIYRQRRFRKKFNEIGKLDSVTGLMNYSSHKAVSQRLLNEEKHKYAYVSVAINRFSFIAELNDKSECDEILKNIAVTISSMLGEDETIGRVNDNSFGMLLYYEDELQFRQRLIRILKHAGDIPKTNNNFCNITFHSGVCLVDKQTNIDKVIRCAQKARVCIGNASVTNINFYQHKSTNKQGHYKIVKDAADAISEERLLIYLQPKYRVDSEIITGVEALIRWNHPVNGILSPNVFLPLLEENGAIVQVDFYVLKTVCQIIREWIEMNKQPIVVSINLSIQHLDNPLFVQKIVNIVDEYQVPHGLIEFEFPEYAIYEKQDKLIQAMRKLSRLGFVISVDNFGAGYSAAYLLKELPIQLIKIDKGLIKDLEDSEFADKERTLVTHIISMAKEMDVEVVAEGVETQAQMELLKQEQCDIIQGYYYQKPMPPEEFTKLLVTAE